MIKGRRQQNNGFVALMTAMLISVALITLVISVSFEGFYGRFAVLDSELKEMSTGAAEACIYTAILRLSNSKDFTGSPIEVNGAECQIIDIDLTSGVVQAQGKYKGFYTNLEVEVNPDSFPNIEIVEWKELPSF